MEFVQPIRDKRQVDAMKKILKSTNLRDYCLFVLGINSGLRVSDLLSLRVGDVVDERGKVNDRINIREQKTGKTKDFPLGETSKKALRDYLTSRFTKHVVRDEPLFRSKKGGAMQRSQAHKVMNDAARAIGITDRIGTHTLRKTFAYHAYMSGTDITRLQKLLNHSSPSITLAYIGITQQELDNVYLSLEL
ncbi:site-specific integrase [Sulfoacidibacillus ferrooxidans]|nr:site-specific integrase [Sulfoacidibacillus ferrooxidans]